MIQTSSFGDVHFAVLLHGSIAQLDWCRWLRRCLVERRHRLRVGGRLYESGGCIRNLVDIPRCERVGQLGASRLQEDVCGTLEAQEEAVTPDCAPCPGSEGKGSRGQEAVDLRFAHGAEESRVG